MNIGLFTDTYYPQINGVATSLLTLEKELTAMGHKVYIFTVSDPNATHKDNVFRMPSMPLFFSKGHRIGISYPPQILLTIRKLKLDLIHTHSEFTLGIFGKVVSEVLGIPLIHTYHTMWEDYVHYVGGGHVVGPKAARLYSRIFCNRAKVVIAPTAKTKESLLSYGVKKPIKIIPTGIDFAPFSPSSYSADEISALRESIGLKPKDKVLLSIGRVAKEKSMDLILRNLPKIAEHIPKIKMVIVGDGPALEDIKALAKTLGLKKHLLCTGSRPFAEIGKYYQIGDVFVSASTSETQGLTYAEAMAAHLPVVAKLDKSITGLIKHKETGYTFETQEEMIDAVVDAIANKKERERIISHALKSLKPMSSQRFGHSIAALYADVVFNGA